MWQPLRKKNRYCPAMAGYLSKQKYYVGEKRIRNAKAYNVKPK
jgi:hypothetical protein